MDERAEVARGAGLVQSRRELMGSTPDAATGEEVTTCGDVTRDAVVASVAVDSIRSRLPNDSVTDSHGVVHVGRKVRKVRKATVRRVQRLPCQLFTIEWAMIAPSVSGPEPY